MKERYLSAQIRSDLAELKSSSQETLMDLLRLGGFLNHFLVEVKCKQNDGPENTDLD